MKKFILSLSAVALSLSAVNAVDSEEFEKEISKLKLKNHKEFIKNTKPLLKDLPNHYKFHKAGFLGDSKNIVIEIDGGNNSVPIIISADGKFITGISSFFLANEKIIDDLRARIDENPILKEEIEKKANDNPKIKLAQEMKKLDKSMILEFKNSEASRTTILLSDPECPFCRSHLANEMDELVKNENVLVIFAPVHQRPSWIKAQAILNNAGNKNNEEKLELMKKYYSEFYKLTDEEKKIDTNNIEKIINTIFKNTGIGGVPAAFSYTNKELEDIK